MNRRFLDRDRRRPAGPLGLWPVPLALALAAGCRSEPPARWPFPAVEARDDGAVLAILRERARPPESLYAELTMSFQGADRGGVFDAVVRYGRPDRLRMTAFRDLLLSSREVFDLRIEGERCELALDGEGGAEGERNFSGTLRELARIRPGFRAFSILREGLFLPGSLPGGEDYRVVRSRGELRVDGRAPGGTEVSWRLDPSTLGVRSAEVRLAGGEAPIALSYKSYREASGRYFPERFELIDPGAGVRIEGVLREIELDTPSGGEESGSGPPPRGGPGPGGAVGALASLLVLLVGPAACGAEGTEGREATEAELKALLEELSRGSADLRTLEVRFREEKKLRILRRPRICTGEVAFEGGKLPFKLSIVTRDQEGKVESRLLLRDGEMKIHYPALERLEVLPAKGEAPGGSGGAGVGQDAFRLLFTNEWEKIGKEYLATLVEEGAEAGQKGEGGKAEPEKRWSLTLVPRKPGSAVKKLEVHLSGSRIREYRQEEASGDRVRFEVLEWKANGEIPEDRFRLEIPPGTKVVRLSS